MDSASGVAGSPDVGVAVKNTTRRLYLTTRASLQPVVIKFSYFPPRAACPRLSSHPSSVPHSPPSSPRLRFLRIPGLNFERPSARALSPLRGDCLQSASCTGGKELCWKCQCRGVA